MGVTRNIQEEAFLSYETNSWFEHKKQQLTKSRSDKDPVLNILKDYHIQPRSCLEIGASTGFRLNGIQQLFPNCQAIGIESSKKAVIKGKIQYPSIELMQGKADDLSCFPDECFDLLIGSFDPLVADRMLLLQVIAEMDRVLKEHGKLILIDFFSIEPSANQRHSITPAPFLSYKQNYDEVFRASGLYHLWHKETINNASYLRYNQKSGSNNFGKKACITALKKGSRVTYE